MVTNQKRAAVGGEVGANGDWYEGGKFIATTDHAKSRKEIKATGRCQVENFVWAQRREGFMPLFGMLSGIEIPNRSNGTYSFNPSLCGQFATAEQIVKRQAMIAAWNLGKRWVSIANREVME